MPSFHAAVAMGWDGGIHLANLDLQGGGHEVDDTYLNAGMKKADRGPDKTAGGQKSASTMLVCERTVVFQPFNIQRRTVSFQGV